MGGSLRGIRSRVERLAGQVVRDGCSVCREDEAAVQLCWRDTLADPPVSVTELLAKEPQSKTCTACGRTYELQYTVLTWIRNNPTS